MIDGKIIPAIIILVLGVAAAVWAYRREEWYDNTGTKLKKAAKVLFSAGIFISAAGFGSVLLIFVVFPLMNGEEPTATHLLYLLIGAVSAAITCLLSWLTSLGLHALGQIVENTDPCPPPVVRVNVPPEYRAQHGTTKSREQYLRNNVEWIECPHCGTINNSKNETCSTCNQPL